MVQTTARTEIIRDRTSAIRGFRHFFWTSGDTQFCTFHNKVVGVGCSGEFGTITTVAQYLEGNGIRLG